MVLAQDPVLPAPGAFVINFVPKLGCASTIQISARGRDCRSSWQDLGLMPPSYFIIYAIASVRYWSSALAVLNTLGLAAWQILRNSTSDADRVGEICRKETGKAQPLHRIIGCPCWSDASWSLPGHITAMLDHHIKTVNVGIIWNINFPCGSWLSSSPLLTRPTHSFTLNSLASVKPLCNRHRYLSSFFK